MSTTIAPSHPSHTLPRPHSGEPTPAPLPPPLSGAGGPPTPPMREDPTVGAHRKAPSSPVSKGGPKTPEGKAVASRNATSHGLFAKHAVLPHLGEDPAEYESLLKHLADQVRPRNLLERQYLELWAEASWKLRRLSRLEADLWEQDGLTTAERLSQLERLDRMQSSLRRRMDKAIHMLGPDLPRLFAARTREDLMDHLGLTPSLCAGHPYRERDLEDAVRAHRTYPDPTETDPTLTDTVPADTPAPTEATPEPENSENEPPVPAAADTVGAHRNAPTPNGNAPKPAHKTQETQKLPKRTPLPTQPLYNSFTVGHRHPSPSGEGKGEPRRAGGGTPGTIPARPRF